MLIKTLSRRQQKAMNSSRKLRSVAGFSNYEVACMALVPRDRVLLRATRELFRSYVVRTYEQKART